MNIVEDFMCLLLDRPWDTPVFLTNIIFWDRYDED